MINTVVHQIYVSSVKDFVKIKYVRINKSHCSNPLKDISYVLKRIGRSK